MLLQRKYKEIKSYILLLLKKIQNKKQLLFSSGVMIGKQCHFEIIYGHASLGKEFTARNNFSLIVDKNGLCKIGDNCFF